MRRDCGHCASLLPVLESLSLNASSSVRIAAVDCVAHPVLCEGVSSVPSLRWVRQGKEGRYEGSRTLSALSALLTRLDGPAVRLTPPPPPSPDTTLFVASSSCPEQPFASVAEAWRHRFFFFRQPTESTGCRIEAVREEERAEWDGTEDLSAFVEREALPLVAEFDRHSHLVSRLPLMLAFYQGSEQRASVVSILRTAARSVRASSGSSSPALFAVVSADVWDGLRAGAVLPYPSLTLVDTARLNHHYPFGGSWENAEEIASHVSAFQKGLLNRTLISEKELPEKNEDGTVRVVGSTLQRVIEAAGQRDVLIFFGSASCGSSVASQPFWREVVKRVGQSPDLILGAGDGWANDWTIELSGLPDFRLFPGDDKKGTRRYTGPRNADAMIAWLKDMAYNEIQDTLEDKSEL